MTIRKALPNNGHNDDLERIWTLGQEFGHLMTYVQTKEGIEPHLRDIIVHEDENGVVDAFFHCRTLLDQEDYKFILEEKTIPDFLLDGALTRSLDYAIHYKNPLGVCMQGGSHREVFQELIKYLQTQYSELWCWCSIKSRRPEGYRNLGFSFNPAIHYSFHNPHVDRQSTYQLGRWVSE